MIEIWPFSIILDATAIAGSALWSLALYWGVSPLTEWVIMQLNRWFNYAERSLYTSESEYEKTRVARESQNAFYAAIFSILPFLIAGGLFNWGIEIAIGQNWTISVGLIACCAGAVYELGRRSNSNNE